MSAPISKDVKLFCATLVFLMLLYIAAPFIQIFIFVQLTGRSPKIDFHVNPDLREEKL